MCLQNQHTRCPISHFTICNTGNRLIFTILRGGKKHSTGINNKEISRGCAQHDEAMTLRCLIEILSSVGAVSTFPTAFIWRAAAAVVSHNALFVVCVCAFVCWSGWRVWSCVEGLISWETRESSEWTSFFMTLSSEKVLDHYSAMSSTPTSCCLSACVGCICVYKFLSIFQT